MPDIVKQGQKLSCVIHVKKKLCRVDLERDFERKAINGKSKDAVELKISQNIFSLQILSYINWSARNHGWCYKERERKKKR